jgi:hypothetical protein
MERGDEALMALLAPSTIVIARLDRATQYAVTLVVLRKPLEYWITRFRG